MTKTVYLPYIHSVLTRGNSHRILISDLQLLQWYSRRRNIRNSPLPYCIVNAAILNLLADRKILAGDDTSAPILVNPLLDSADNVIDPPQPAVIQHLETLVRIAPIPTSKGRRLSTSYTTTPPQLQQ